MLPMWRVACEEAINRSESRHCMLLNVLCTMYVSKDVSSGCEYIIKYLTLGGLLGSSAMIRDALIATTGLSRPSVAVYSL